MAVLKFKKDEEIVVNLYGKEINLTAEVKRGKKTFELFGDKYEIEIVEIKNVKKESRK